MRDYEPRERALEPKEPVVFCTCDECGQDIYEGEEYWVIDGCTVCDDCLRAFAEDYFWQNKRIAEIDKNLTK